MKTLLCSLFLGLLLLTPARAQLDSGLADMTVGQMEAQAPDLHPAALYVLAARLLGEGRGQEAANWMYAGQLRYRFLLAAATPEEAAEQGILFSALTEQVGRPVNEYIGGDVDEWLAAMDWALAWDAANSNGTTSKAGHAEILDEQRAGLERLRQSIEDSRDTIPAEREANGLENR